MAIRRYKYSMRHSWITGMRIGQLLPIFCQEVTPGDTWRGQTNGLLRMAPMDQPAFVALNAHVHFFFVPHRIVWDEFEDVITGEDTTTSWPTVNKDDTAVWTIPSALGLGPADTGQSYSINALPVYAYNMVWNEFFRDQDMDTALALTNLQIANARYPASSYHTRARNEIQQGSEETVTVTAGEWNITDMRDALHRQKFRERRSQFGHRYHDYLQALGLRVPDSRLDRPEHVARGKTVIGVSEVVGTGDNSIGEYRGHGIAGIKVNFRKRVFLEHGTLIGVLALRPRLQLRKRIDRMYYTTSKDQLFQPELSRDTQVPVFGGEVTSEDQSEINTIWGYVPRDEWLRSANDVIACTMQDTPGDGWTTGRDFGVTLPGITTFNAVPAFNELFQDTGGTAIHTYCYFDHRIGKRSIVPRSAK